MRNLLRASMALALATALIGFLGLPVCFSTACPMSATERAACMAMGRECCGTKGQVSHAPSVPAPVLATAPAALALAAPAVLALVACAESTSAIALPAVLQGIGLFTLFAVFLI